MTTESCTGTLNLVDLAGSERIKVNLQDISKPTSSVPDPVGSVINWPSGSRAAFSISDPDPCPDLYQSFLLKILYFFVFTV
jgi:hypothetical protein